MWTWTTSGSLGTAVGDRLIGVARPSAGMPIGDGSARRIVTGTTVVPSGPRVLAGASWRAGLDGSSVLSGRDTLVASDGMDRAARRLGRDGSMTTRAVVMADRPVAGAIGTVDAAAPVGRGGAAASIDLAVAMAHDGPSGADGSPPTGRPTRSPSNRDTTLARTAAGPACRPTSRSR